MFKTRSLIGFLFVSVLLLCAIKRFDSTKLKKYIPCTPNTPRQTPPPLTNPPIFNPDNFLKYQDVKVEHWIKEGNAYVPKFDSAKSDLTKLLLPDKGTTGGYWSGHQITWLQITLNSKRNIKYIYFQGGLGETFNVEYLVQVHYKDLTFKQFEFKEKYPIVKKIDLDPVKKLYYIFIKTAGNTAGSINWTRVLFSKTTI